MSQRTSRRHARCSHDNCGSRRLHVADDGFTYCHRGHQQSELGTVVAEDTGELVTLGKTSRRKVDSDAESQTSRVSGFSGTKAFEHYLLCLQLVLRKQLKWLIDVQNLPGELESLVRDLWALFLQKFRDRTSYDSGTDTEAGASQQFSSQSENDTDAESTRTGASRQRSRKKLKRNGPSVKDAASLIYIGILLLRLPLTVADLHRWINDGKLLYYRAVKEIPLPMLDRLPGEYQRMLEPQILLNADQLHNCILESLSTMHTEFGMVAPPINHVLVLFRWVKGLSLPLEICVATKRLARLQQFDFAYSVEAPAWSNIILRYPEIRLMALIVIATKLLFPFDGISRYPTSAKDLAALKMDWAVWVQSQSQAQDTADIHGRANSLAYQDCFTMTEQEVIGLADDRLDEYLDWYEFNIASEEVRERGRAGHEANFRKTLFRLFPTDSVPRGRPEIGVLGDTSADRLHRIQAAQHPNRIVPRGQSDDVPRPGSSYPQFRTEDELTGAIRKFYEQSARLAGSSLPGLVRAVFSVERRLLDREREMRRHDHDRLSTSAA